MAAAEPAATESSTSIQVAGETSTSYICEAVSVAASAVNTKRYHILGFVSS